MTRRALTSPKLRAGDRVRLVSPASAPDGAWLAESIATLEGWSLTVEVAPHAMDTLGYMAGADRDRLGTLGVPVLGGLFAGHDLRGADGENDQLALPLGTEATLDTEAGTLVAGPVVH